MKNRTTLAACICALIGTIVLAERVYVDGRVPAAPTAPSLGPQVAALEAGTNAWQTAYSWGDHALAGYLLPAALAPYATTGHVAQAVAPLGPRLDRIEAGTNAWYAAYAWGDHALAGYLLPADLSPYATTAALAVHTNRIDNPHSVTAAQIGALTAEVDPVAVVHTNRIDNPHAVTATQIGALTTESDPVANAALAVHTNRIDNPHSVTAAQIGALVVELDPVANAALAVHTNRADNPHNVTASQIGALTTELDPVANAALVVHTNRVDNPHNVTASQIGALTAEADPVAGPRLDLIEAGTNAWQTAYGWGDHALAGYLLPAALAPYATTAALTVHTNRTDNPHSVTAAQIGALTAESDPVANAALAVHTNRVDNPHNVTATQIGALTAELDPVANAALTVHTNRVDNPHNVTAAQIGALTAEVDPVANAALVVHTNRVDNPHSVTAAQIGAITAEADPVAGPRLDRIEAGTNAWQTAYSWGNHALAGYLLPADLGPYDTSAALVVHTNRIDNPHNVTASQIGALTAELDPVANAKLVIHTNRADNPHNVTAVQIGALTAELDPVANAKLVVHTNRADNPHGVTAVQIGALTAEADPVSGPRLDRIEPATNKWNAAYGWGDHAAVGYLLPAALAPYATTAALVVHTNRIDNPHSVTAAQIGAITAELDPIANAKLVIHTNRADNPHSVTAVQIGALTAELDPVANAKLVVHTNRIDNPHNVTAVQIGALTAELDPVANAKLAVHTNRIDNPHNVTAIQIGALTAELDPVANAKLVVHTNRVDNPHNVTAVQIGAVPYTGAAKTVNIGNNDLIVSNDVHVGDDVIVGGHIEVDGRIDLLGEGRYITGASYISGLVPLDPNTWHVSDRAVSGTFLYSGLRSAVDEAIWTAEYQLSLWASTNGLASTQQVADAVAPLATTAALAVHTNRTDNPHSVTAIQIGALTAELDPVANAALTTHANRDDNPHSVTAVQIGALTAELDPVAGPRLDRIEAGTNAWQTAYSWGDHALAGYLLPAALTPYATTAALVVHTNRNDNPHNVTAAQIGALTTELDPVANAALVIHTNRIDNPHNVTATQIGALTNELDLAALRMYHYGSPDIVESPAGWFVFDGAGTITAFNWAAGRTNAVIPWEIGGVPVTAIGDNAFVNSGVVSLIAPQTVTSIEENAFDSCTSLASVSLPQAQTVGAGAFAGCTSLTSVSLPQVQTVGNSAFSGCTSLTSVSLPQAQTVGSSAFMGCTSLTYASLPQAQTVEAVAFDSCTSLTSVSLPQAQTVGDYAFVSCTSLTSVYFDNDAPTIGDLIFGGITPNQVTNYVANPQAAGWGATWNGMPVVRPTLSADAIYQAGELVATEAHVAQALAAIPEPDLSDRPTFSQIAASNALPYTAWTGTVTPVNGTATVTIAHGNMPVLVTTAPCVLTLDPTGYGTSGVSRVSLSYYTGGNSFTFSTDVIQYAETPTVDTSGWNTLLIRRVSNGAWKGVGL